MFDQAPDVPQYVRADEGKLRQVLINLLGNAVKFTQEGEIVASVQCIVDGEQQTTHYPLPTIHYPLPLRSAPGTIVSTTIHFSVQDTGVGIASEELDAVFDAFVQTASGQQTQRGTGLGMPISRQFVRLMGGDLTVFSPPPAPPVRTGGERRGGAGTVFQFDVRVELVDAADVLSAQSTRRIVGLEPGQPIFRLLVVEDEEANRRLMFRLLSSLRMGLSASLAKHPGEIAKHPGGIAKHPGGTRQGLSASSRQGFEVRVAVDGQQAIEIWQDWRPHLIWMDIRMPVMDGHEAIKIIKATPQGQETVIVALTASVFEEKRAAIMADGCDDFVRKPFRQAEIFDVLSSRLGVRFVYEGVERGDEIEIERGDREALLAALAAMPAAWRADLRQATIEGDLDWIMTQVEQIHKLKGASGQDAELIGWLTELADNFAHDEMLKLIQQATEN